MGTSSSYGGPTGGRRLLPPWAEDPVPADNPEDEDSGQDDLKDVPKWVEMGKWNAPKSNMKRFVSEGGRGNLNRSISSYVRSKGGPKGASSSAVAGRGATVRLGGFLSDVSKNGIGNAVMNLGLRGVIGQPVEVAFTAILQRLAPSGSTLEEAIARRAVNNALDYVFERYEVSEDRDLEKINSVDESGIKEAIKIVTTNYIYQRILQELGDRIEKHALSASSAVRIERDVKAYIEDAVQFDFGNINVRELDWESGKAREIVDQIYAEAYSHLEVGE